MLISVEGIDGTGKSTLVRALATALTLAGRKVTTIAYPDRSNPVGEMLGAVLEGREKVPASALMGLFHADACIVGQTKMRPALNAGHVVISDRHPYFSALAYQTEQWGTGYVTNLFEGFRKPDLLVVLDMAPEQALRRTLARGDADFFEQADLDTITRRRVKYLSIGAYHPEIHAAVLPAERDVEHLSHAVQARIEALRVTTN